MMNEHNILDSWLWQYGGKFLAATVGVALIAAPLQAAEPAKAEPVKAEAAKAEAAKTAPAKKPAKAKTTSAKKPVKAAVTQKPATVPGVTAQPSLVPPASTIEFAPQVGVTLGKSTLLKLPEQATRVSVGNPAVADVILLNPREVYLIGKSVGTTNVILWSKTGHSTVVDVTVGMDTVALQGKLQQLLPGEKDIKVAVAADSLVLTGTVSDAVKVDKAVALAEAYGGKKVVNFLQTGAPQQVMLEVKVAEVSRSLMDKLGVDMTMSKTSGSWTYKLLSGFLTGSSGKLSATKDANHAITLDAERKDGLVKILAEPTIMAMSGQEGSFLAGGKVYIPIAQSGTIGGASVITLEEKEFGVGLKFTPIVLENGRINLKVSPEVSELSATGTTISTVGIGSNILPTITTRRASTTLQLNDGQSFAIGGLIKNNVTETIKAFPILGEIPILGALFRSSDFQNDKTELLFVVTPHLVKPLPPDYALPTDGFVPPTRGEFFLDGKLEGAPRAESQAAAAPAELKEPAPATGGFQMR